VPAAPGIAGYRLGCSNAEGMAGRCEKAGLKVREKGREYSVALPAALGGSWILA
jgi:hypothetical protein